MRLMALVVVAGLLWPISGFSQNLIPYRSFADGNALYELCSSPGATDQSYCAGYLGGISDSLSSSQHLCVSTEVSLRQLKDVVLKYLRDHPEQRGQAAFSVGREALTLAFPCK